MNTQEQPLAYSVTEVCDLLGLSRSTVGKLIRDGELRSKRVGTRVLITPEAVDAFLAGVKP